MLSPHLFSPIRVNILWGNDLCFPFLLNSPQVPGIILWTVKRQMLVECLLYSLHRINIKASTRTWGKKFFLTSSTAFYLKCRSLHCPGCRFLCRRDWSLTNSLPVKFTAYGRITPRVNRYITYSSGRVLQNHLGRGNHSLRKLKHVWLSIAISLCD